MHAQFPVYEENKINTLRYKPFTQYKITYYNYIFHQVEQIFYYIKHVEKNLEISI